MPNKSEPVWTILSFGVSFLLSFCSCPLSSCLIPPNSTCHVTTRALVRASLMHLPCLCSCWSVGFPPAGPAQPCPLWRWSQMLLYVNAPSLLLLFPSFIFLLLHPTSHASAAAATSPPTLLHLLSASPEISPSFFLRRFSQVYFVLLIELHFIGAKPVFYLPDGDQQSECQTLRHSYFFEAAHIYIQGLKSIDQTNKQNRRGWMENKN